MQEAARDERRGVAVIEVVGGGLLAAWLCACLFLACNRIVWSLGRGAPGPLRWTALLVTGMAVATVGFFLLFPLGLFRPVPAAVAAGALLGVVRWLLPGPSSGALLGRDLRILRWLFRPRQRRILDALWIVFVPPAVLVVARTLASPPLAWDTLTYHGPRAAFFVQNAGFTFEPGPGSWSLYRHFFAGAEVLVAWAMLPFHSDLLASLVNGVEWLGLGVACWALARELGLRGLHAALSAWASLFVPTLLVEVPSGYVEVPLMLCVVASLVFALHFLRRSRAVWAFFAIAAGGLASGIKVQGALPAAVVTLWLLAACVLSPRHRSRAAGLAMAAGVAVALLAVLPWTIPPWRETGAPLSPMPVELFGLALGKADPAMLWYRMRDVSEAYTWERELSVLRMIFAPPGSKTESLGLWSMLPLLVFPVGWALQLRRRPAEMGMLLVAILGTLALLWSPALNVPRLHWSLSISRYLVGAVLIALPISLAIARRLPRLGTLYAHLLLGGFAFYAISYSLFGWAPYEILFVVTLLTAAAVLVAAVAAATRRSARGGRWVASIALLALLCAVERGQTMIRHQVLALGTQVHGVPRFWLEGARALDQPSRRFEIAVTSGARQESDQWFAYPFLGRRLQNRLHYVPITRDGEIAHFGPGHHRERRARRAAWLRRLEERGITHVVSFFPHSIEQGWMESLPRRFERVVGNEEWGVFRVIAASPPAVEGVTR